MERIMQIKGFNIQSKHNISLWGTYNKVGKRAKENFSYPVKASTSNPFADLNIDYIGVV